jgi:hypothetical protein
MNQTIPQPDKLIFLLIRSILIMNHDKAGIISLLAFLQRYVEPFVLLRLSRLINHPLIIINNGILNAMSIDFPNRKSGHVCPDIH